MCDALVSSLTEEDLDMTVGEYIQAQCDRKVQALKRHMDQSITTFEAEARKARKALCDVTAKAVSGEQNGAEDAPEQPASSEAPAEVSEGGGSDGRPDCEEFALFGLQGPFAMSVFTVRPSEQKEWTIGRDESNTFCLGGDHEVSGSHAKICYDTKTEQFKLMDVGSTNGTFATSTLVKAAKLKKKKYHTIKDGYLITFGKTTFKWCYQADALKLLKETKAKK